MKKVLVIAHEFPPFSGGFVMRALKFCKYLPEFGWSSIVMASKPEDCYFASGWGRDASLLDELPEEVTIVYASSPMERFLRKMRVGLRRKPSTMQSVYDERGGKPQLSQKTTSVLRNFHVFQDQSGLWNPYAYAAAMKLLAENKVDAVITTSPPHWVHMVGYKLKRKTGLPWVADFRDGWRDNPIFQARSATRRRFDDWQESRVVSLADIVLGVTPHIVRVLRNNYPIHQNKFKLLHNGFDPEDFNNLPSSPREGCVTFIHLGNLGGIRDPNPLLAAFQHLVIDRSLQPDQARIQFIGQDYGLVPARYPQVPIDVMPTMSHREAIACMQSAGVLVLIAGIQEGEGAFTSKVFEYLAARRPILAIIPPTGELSDLLSRYSLSTIASPEDPEQIRAGILHSIRLAQASPVLNKLDESIIAQYDRRLLTGNLATILNTLVSS